MGSFAAYLLAVCFLVTLNFVLPRALPGDPIPALSDPSSQSFVGDDTTRAKVERYYGLDRPALEQYGDYVRDLAHGDLGTSIRYNRPVTEVLAARLGWTALLVGTALALATAVGMLAGVSSGWRRGRPADRRMLGLFLALDNFPVFFMASLVASSGGLAPRLSWRCSGRRSR